MSHEQWTAWLIAPMTHGEFLLYLLLVVFINIAFGLAVSVYKGFFGEEQDNENRNV